MRFAESIEIVEQITFHLIYTKYSSSKTSPSLHVNTIISTSLILVCSLTYALFATETTAGLSDGRSTSHPFDAIEQLQLLEAQRSTVWINQGEGFTCVIIHLS